MQKMSWNPQHWFLRGCIYFLTLWIKQTELKLLYYELRCWGGMGQGLDHGGRKTRRMNNKFFLPMRRRFRVITDTKGRPGGFQRDVVFADQYRPRIRVQMRGGRVARSQPMSTAVHITWHGAQINFGNLPQYLTYGADRVSWAFRL